MTEGPRFGKTFCCDEMIIASRAVGYLATYLYLISSRNTKTSTIFLLYPVNTRTNEIFTKSYPHSIGNGFHRTNSINTIVIQSPSFSPSGTLLSLSQPMEVWVQRMEAGFIAPSSTRPSSFLTNEAQGPPTASGGGCCQGNWNLQSHVSNFCGGL